MGLDISASIMIGIQIDIRMEITSAIGTRYDEITGLPFEKRIIKNKWILMHNNLCIYVSEDHSELMSLLKENKAFDFHAFEEKEGEYESILIGKEISTTKSHRNDPYKILTMDPNFSIPAEQVREKLVKIFNQPSHVFELKVYHYLNIG